MHILFTDTHPRRIAESTPTDSLQNAMDDLVRILQTTGYMYDRLYPVFIDYKSQTGQHQQMADWCSQSSSNWRHLSNILSMLLFEVAVRHDWRRRRDINNDILNRDFITYKRAVTYTGTHVPDNLPENGFFDIPFILDPFYSEKSRNPMDAYRLAYADRSITDDDLDARDVPAWLNLYTQQLIDIRKKKLHEYEANKPKR